jgi:hypothetical protein
MATCGIAPEDDDGNAASRKQPQRDAIAIIAATKSLAELQSAWNGFSAKEKLTATAAKDKRKAELNPFKEETKPEPKTDTAKNVEKVMDELGWDEE